MTLRQLVVSVSSGLLFGVLDGVINANPLGRELLAVYQPIARASINVVAGLAIDLVYGFALAAMFMFLRPSLPGSTGWRKGLWFGVGVWFLRVVMSAASSWMMFNVSLWTVAYMVATGLMEMLALGLLYGATLEGAARPQ